MAILFNSAADALLLMGAAPAADPVAMSCWYFHDAAPSSSTAPLWQLVNDTGTTFDGIGLTSSSVLRVFGNGSPASVTGSTLSIGSWHWFFYRRTGGTHQLYLDGALDITRTSANSVTSQNVVMGGNTAVASAGALAAVKMWTSAVTIDSVWNEQFFYTPLRTSDLWSWWRLFDIADLADLSGQGRTLSINSTPATIDGPPILWSPARVRPGPIETPVVGGGAKPWMYYQRLRAA